MHLLLGSTRVLRADENRNFCKWALGRCWETSLLLRTEHGNSHRFWGIHQKRAVKWAREKRCEIRNWHQLSRFQPPFLQEVKTQCLVFLLLAFAVLVSHLPQIEVSRWAAPQWLCPNTQTCAVWARKTNPVRWRPTFSAADLSNAGQRQLLSVSHLSTSVGWSVQNCIPIALFKQTKRQKMFHSSGQK